MLCYPMPLNIQPSNELLKKPFDEMWSNLEFRPQKDKMKQQRSSKSCSKNVNKLKTKSVVDDPCNNEKLETLREIFQRESVEESSSSTQSEELIKYMSNLPGYLKRSDRGKNVQEKALNVGVLDWSQLEKWKNKQSHIPLGTQNFTSFNSCEESTSFSSRAATTSSTNARGHKKLHDRKGLHSSGIKGDYKEVLSKSSKLSSHNVKQYQYSETEKSMKSLQQHSLKKKERNLSCSDKGLASLEPKDKGVSFGSHKKMSSRSNESKIKMDRWPEQEVDVDHRQCHGMPRDIVLLRPRKFLQSRFDDYFQLSQSKTSSDENFEESSQSSSSYISLSEKFHTEDPYSESLHSRVLLPSVTSLASSETTRHRVNTDLDVDRSFIASKKPDCSNKMSNVQPKETCIEKNDVFEIKPRSKCSFSNVKESKASETAELTAERVRNNSFQSRVDFGLNQIGRISSYKEGSNLPKLSSMYVSAKSGPVRSESFASLDNSSKDKVKGHKRSKSSPFMRLLDPIRKHKSSYIDHSSESSFNTSSLHCEESKESSTQALLQLTVKNGLPLFKFVLNSERKVFAATMNSLASLEKDDGSCYFTFYLLNEIKKKSGKWMSHWSKEKKCGFVYNIVGQMKISSSKITELERRCMVKDYVLFGVGVDETDQGSKEFIKSREHAAAVIEIPCDNVSHEGVHLMKKECLKCLLANETCFCISQEIDSSGSVTVILPGGVHSSPIKGEPSPLIHRWKLGGLCDCGGWDVGCKLLVLSNQNPCPNILRSSNPHPKRFQLFVKEEAEQSTPLFILEPLKDGLYSVEFSSTINHLQAFFISVAVLSSQKLPSSLEMSNNKEEINKELSFKNINELQEKTTKNYNTIPPVSPVDRV